MNSFLLFLGAIALGITHIFYRLFVMSRIWLYVMVPLGAPVIGLWNIWGLSLFIACSIGPQEQERDLKKAAEQTVESFVSLSIGWFLAWALFGPK